MKINIESKNRKRIYIICKNCNQYKKHKARGLCENCYDKLWKKNRLSTYEKTKAHTLESTEQFVLLTTILDKYEWGD